MAGWRVRRRVSAVVAALLVVCGGAVTDPARAGSVGYRLSVARLPDGSRVVLRWNPCQLITYRVNVAAVPVAERAAVLADARAAVGVLAARTGLRFGYRGATREVPSSTSLAGQSAELVVAVTTPARTDFPIGGQVVGYGGRAWYWWSRTGAGRTVYGAAITRGFVVVETGGLLRLRRGFGPGATRGNLLLHELGHAVGLDHTADPRTLMYPQLRRTAPNGFAAGDRAGLARLGRGAGCIAVPSDLPTRDLN